MPIPPAAAQPALASLDAQLLGAVRVRALWLELEGDAETVRSAVQLFAGGAGALELQTSAARGGRGGKRS